MFDGLANLIIYVSYVDILGIYWEKEGLMLPIPHFNKCHQRNACCYIKIRIYMISKVRRLELESGRNSPNITRLQREDLMPIHSLNSYPFISAIKSDIISKTHIANFCLYRTVIKTNR